MQGRLLPPVGGRFQAFPAAHWRDEFPRAAAAGLACIEWIYEKPDRERNPLRNKAGIEEIKECARKYGVFVRSICADYFMTEHLVDAGGSPIAAHVAHLEWLIRQAEELRAAYIVLPFVDSSSLRTPMMIRGAAAVLYGAAGAARESGVELHVESDLPPGAFRSFLDSVGEPLVKANYDIGNSASLGYPPGEEIPMIAPHLGSVHVKDRKRDGGTVPLGSGDADLNEAFRQIRAAKFDRWLVMQVARDESIDHVEWARQNREIVERLWKVAY